MKMTSKSTEDLARYFLEHRGLDDPEVFMEKLKRKEISIEECEVNFLVMDEEGWQIDDDVMERIYGWTPMMDLPHIREQVFGIMDKVIEERSGMKVIEER